MRWKSDSGVTWRERDPDVSERLRPSGRPIGHVANLTTRESSHLSSSIGFRPRTHYYGFKIVGGYHLLYI
jgi:hypothetical protein